jgi:hypothetical protein
MKKIVTSSATVLSLAIVSAFAQETETKTATNAITNLAIGKIESIVSSEAQKLEDEVLKSISVDLSVNDGEVGGEITGVVKLTESDDSFTFTQLTAGQFDSRTTVNIGLGNRIIISDRSAILGGNIFLDYEFKSKHSRAGLGFEYITNTGSLRANYYNGLSGTKVYKGIEEKALDGADLKYSYRFEGKYNPEVFVRGFQWKGDAGYKENGLEAGVNLEIARGLRLSMSGRDDNKGDATFNAGIVYSIPLGEIPESKVPKASQSSNIVSRELLYQPVQRENRIRKSQVKMGIVMTTF